MTTQKVISLVPMLFITLAAFTGASGFKKFPLGVKIMVVAWLLVFLVETAGHITGFFKIRNLWMYNIFFLLWFLTLAFAYQSVLQKTILRKLISFFYFFLPLLFLVNVLYLQGNNDLQSLFFVTGGCFIIFLSIVYFQQLYQSVDNDIIQTDPFFWFSAGLLLYFGINILYLGMYNSLNLKAYAFSKIYLLYISNAVIILLNLCVWKGFLCRKTSLR